MTIQIYTTKTETEILAKGGRYNIINRIVLLYHFTKKKIDEFLSIFYTLWFLYILRIQTL
jgi:hypothetical protein